MLSIVVDALSSVRRDEVSSNSLLVTDLIVSTVSKSKPVCLQRGARDWLRDPCEGHPRAIVPLIKFGLCQI